MQPPDYAHGDVILRNNKIRYVDGVVKATYTGEASRVNGAKALQVQNNVLSCIPANSMKNSRCGAATYFNDLTPLGTLLQGYNIDTSVKYDELATMTEDSFVMSFLQD